YRRHKMDARRLQVRGRSASRAARPRSSYGMKFPSREIDAYIERMVRILEPLHTEAGGLPADAAIQELHTALEELRVVEEERRQQHEELLHTREALDRERQRYRDLFQLAPEAYLLTSHTGQVREANQAAGAL